MNRLAPALIVLGLLCAPPAPAGDAPAGPPPSPAAPAPLLDVAAVRSWERARPAEAPAREVVLERQPPPLGIEGAGPARQGDGRGRTSAFVLEDDRVLVVRGDRRATFGGPGSTPEVRARRVAVLRDGTVVVLARTGHLYAAELGTDDLAGPPLAPLNLRVQAQAQLATPAGDAGEDEVWIGTEAGAVLRLRPAARTLETIWASGDAPVTAIAAGEGLVVVGRGDGVLEAARPGEPLRTVARFATTVTAAAARRSRIAAAAGPVLAVLRTDRGEVTIEHLVTRRGDGPLTLLPYALTEPDAAPFVVLATGRPSPGVEVVSLDPRIRGTRLDLATPSAAAGAATWSVEDVRGVRASEDGSAVHLVVPHEGAERLLRVDVRPLPSPAGR